MSEFRLEHSFDETVKKMTEEVQRRVDQEILDANAHVLEEFGYVKVVRCRDCAFFAHDLFNGEHSGYCTLFDFGDVNNMENKFCAWAKRKELS